MQNARGSEAFLIASVVSAICMVCTVGSVKVAGWPQPPSHLVEVATPKDQARHPQDVLKPIRVATVSYRLDPPVQKISVHEIHERTSLPWSCETIRSAVAKLSKEQMDALARMYRLTPQQKADARNCLKEKRT